MADLNPDEEVVLEHAVDVVLEIDVAIENPDLTSDKDYGNPIHTSNSSFLAVLVAQRL